MCTYMYTFINTVCTLPWRAYTHPLLGNKARGRGEANLGLGKVGWLTGEGGKRKAWATGEAETMDSKAERAERKEKNPLWKTALDEVWLETVLRKDLRGVCGSPDSLSLPASVPECGITWVSHSAWLFGSFYHPCLQRWFLEPESSRAGGDGEQVQEGMGRWDTHVG